GLGDFGGRGALGHAAREPGEGEARLAGVERPDGGPGREGRLGRLGDLGEQGNFAAPRSSAAYAAISPTGPAPWTATRQAVSDSGGA
ncbi:MAG: hypothetical protein FWE75_05220, partial [Actinomycetia bacterium]|nr:hypothetical protein [Actinomycetes bacterium]